MRQVHHLTQEEIHLPGKIKIEKTIQLSQQARKRVHQLKLFGFQKMPVSHAITRTYTKSCNMIHRGQVSLEKLVIHIISLELLWV